MHMLFLGLWVRAVPVVSGGAILDMADDTITDMAGGQITDMGA